MKSGRKMRPLCIEKKSGEKESNDINQERWQTAHLFRVDKKGEMTTRNGVCRTQLREMEKHTPRR